MQFLKKNFFKTSLLCTAITVTLFSCKSTKHQTKGLPFAIKEIKSGDNSGYATPEAIEIRNPAKLAIVWNQLFIKYDRKAPIPKIDFEKNMLLAITLGERNSGGHSIQAASVTELKNAVSVVIEEISLDKVCVSTSMMTYPFQLIEIPKTEKTINFTRTKKIKSCNKGF